MPSGVQTKMNPNLYKLPLSLLRRLYGSQGISYEALLRLSGKEEINPQTLASSQKRDMHDFFVGLMGKRTIEPDNSMELTMCNEVAVRAKDSQEHLLNQFCKLTKRHHHFIAFKRGSCRAIRTEGAEGGRALRLESQVPKVLHDVAIPSPFRRLSAASRAPPFVGSRCPAGVFRVSPRSRGCRTQRDSFFCLPSLPPPPAASPSSSAWQGSLLPASHRRLMASRANPLKPGLLQCPLRGWGRRWARPSRGRMEPLGRGWSSTSSARPGWRVGEAGALCVCESGDAAHRLPELFTQSPPLQCI
ncbi:tachykinin-3 [Crotalus adamanteus]|uniref:Tachykinin-3 n=1 Tax=Crotalus adamanteus TaxID=8729 RepID=A0AAW1BXZ3_CROAD